MISQRSLPRPGVVHGPYPQRLRMPDPWWLVAADALGERLSLRAASRGRGLPFEPCFNLDRTSQVSFRGSVSGLGFAYCNFTKRSSRADLQASTYQLRGVRASAGED